MHNHLRGDVLVQANLNLHIADGADVLALDVALVHRNAVLRLQLLGNFRARNRAVQPPLCAALHRHADDLAAQGVRLCRRVGAALGFAFGFRLAHLLNALHRAGGRFHRQLLGEQEVARVAIRRIHNLILLANTLHIFQQNNLHNLYPP